MHGVSVFDSFSIGHKKAPGDGGCATSGFGYSGDQNAVHMLRATLLVILPEPKGFSIGEGIKHGVFPSALAVPTDLKLEKIFHCLGLFDELSIGDGGGLCSPGVPVQPPNISSNKV